MSDIVFTICLEIFRICRAVFNMLYINKIRCVAEKMGSDKEKTKKHGF